MSPRADGYEDLRKAIVSGELLPGERLLEEDLSARLGLGRAAVRMALVRLEHDGLVQRERHRGATVRRVSESEAVEILEARAALEGLAARHAAQNADDAAVGRLRGIVAEMQELREGGDLLGVSNANAQLHGLILETSRHQTAKRLSQTLSSQLVRFQYRTVLLPGRSEHSYAEHMEIVEAIAAHDPEAAEQAMRSHLSRVAEALRTHDAGSGPDPGADPNATAAPAAAVQQQPGPYDLPVVGSFGQRPGRPPGTSRAAVSRTALEMFAERGFEETTVDDIAAALGVSRRTLFRYFASKSDMAWGDFDWVLARLRRCLDATDPDEPLHEALRAAVVESNRYEDEQLPELRIRMRLITAVPALQAHSALRYAEWRTVIAEFVAGRLGCETGDLVPQTVAHAALGTSMAAFLVWVDDPSSDLVE
ncbi:MAG: mycofactocin system transcriptional regulator, partial [Solirubrobacteraceae bacterium]